MKSILTTLFAALSLLAVVVSAEAQALGTLSRSLPGATTEAVGGAPEIVAGYNYMHASNCVVFLDGLAATTCIVSKEGIVACTINPVTQNGMLAACQTGNVVAFYAPDPSIGAFTQFVTFLTK